MPTKQRTTCFFFQRLGVPKVYCIHISPKLFIQKSFKSTKLGVRSSSKPNNSFTLSEFEPIIHHRMDNKTAKRKIFIRALLLELEVHKANETPQQTAIKEAGGFSIYVVKVTNSLFFKIFNCSAQNKILKRLVKMPNDYEI